MAYCDKRDYPKINLYMRLSDGTSHYLASTTWAKTCREAVAVYCAKYPAGESDKLVFARFDSRVPRHKKAYQYPDMSMNR